MLALIVKSDTTVLNSRTTLMGFHPKSASMVPFYLFKMKQIKNLILNTKPYIENKQIWVYWKKKIPKFNLKF